ncbi:hypothetical protein LXL04_022654 [Taraxacum kok-saghyz]
MAPNKDNEDTITWDNDNIVKFCEVCINYITKNGRGQQMRWREIEDLFAERVGWNATTGMLDCSNEWWERKLKEKPEAKKYRHKGVFPSVEEKWDQLFGDAVATGVGCVAPSLNPECVDKVTNVEDQIQDVDGWSKEAYHEYSQYATLESLDYQEGTFWQNFTQEVSGNPNPTDIAMPKTNKSVKRRKRESGGSALMREHIHGSQERHSEIVGLINQGRNNKKDDAGISIAQAMDIINRMTANSKVEIGGDIWWRAMQLFRNPTDRDLFYNMPSDDARLAWIKFAETRNINNIFDIDEAQREELLYHLLLHNQEADDVAIYYYYTHIYKEPCMTSEQTGEAWMKEILNGHPNRCIGAFRMSASLFTKLCEYLQNNYGLTSSDRMSVKENVGIFVYTLALGLSNRDVSERFQRSGETISRVFHEVLESICGRRKGYVGLAREYIRSEDATFRCIPPHIENDIYIIIYIFFKLDCIDGTHIDASIRVTDQMRYRGRKGVPTFNVMAVCDFDMCFTFISVGWEGSAHDTRVFLHAIETPSMNFPKPPDGKYYVVDKGYPDRKGYLAPYPRLRYHQSQFEHVLPTNAQEAFNRAHSSLRSCIERYFGVLKKRWKILNRMSSFSENTQIDVIMAAFTIHNYIRRNDSTDRIFNFVQQHSNYIPTEEQGNRSRFSHDNIRESRHEMRGIRDSIANIIWDARNMN